MKESDLDDLYRDWVHKAKLPPLTRTQYEFARFLLNNSNQISKIGNLEDIFKSVRNYLRNGKS